jgi:hypothetical protein
VGSNATGAIIKNNIFDDVAKAIDNLGGNPTADYNLCPVATPDCHMTGSTNTVETATPGFASPGTDFSLAAGSAAINAGVAIAGYTYNGSAPDIGAFETFTLSSCSVEQATPTVVNYTFTSNLNPPLLPSTGITGFTAAENAVNKTNSSVVRVGDIQVNQTVTAGFTGGTTITATISGSNLTDSALIGGTLNQPFVQTVSGFGCTNNAGAPSAYTWHFAAFKFLAASGTMAAAPQYPFGTTANNLNIKVEPGAAVRLHAVISNADADAPAEGFYLYAQLNNGAAFQVPDTFDSNNIKMCGTSGYSDIPDAGSPTTDRSGLGTTVGQLVRTSSGVPTVDLDNSPATYAAVEYLVCVDTDATPGVDYYDFQIRRQDGSVDKITADMVPRMTIKEPMSSGGF